MKIHNPNRAASGHSVAALAADQPVQDSLQPGALSIEDAWAICADLFCDVTRASTDQSLELVEQELLFCLLGGFGVTYELCHSAACLVAELEPFSDRWSDEGLRTALVAVLESPKFEPRRRDGSLRRYRFPRRKAALIVEARGWLLRHSPLSERLRSIRGSQGRRELLCECSGIGPKSASWILRNVGWGDDLAILDIHVLRALADAGRIGEVQMPRDYELAEVAFLDWCRELDAPPAAFDLFVWEWQRGSFAPR